MSILQLRIVSIFAALGLLMAVQASASLEDISYPISELGNCENQDACFAYCNDSANFDACINFAEANNLLEEDEIAEYRTAEEALAENGGPGGCTTQDACEAYCSDVANMEVCLSFARENGMMSEAELAEATQVLAAIQSGASLPGGCTSQDECEAYCSDTANMEECLAFASAAGFMSEEEIEEARTMMTIMAAGEMPGGCTSPDECEAYCSDEANRDECTSFAIENGLLTEEEIEEMELRIEEFEGPGGCDSEETCSAYCMEEANREECEAFFGEMGASPEGVEEGYDEEQEEYDEEYQSSFVGPGGCTGEEACMNYCLDPANMEECASFFGTQDETETETETGEVFEEVVPSYEEGTEYEYDGGTEYEYEGGSYEESYDDSHYDEPSAFEDFGPEDIPLDLEGEYDEDALDSVGTPYDEIEVTPNAGEPTSESEEHSETNEEVDAGFMKSVKRLFENVVSFLTL